MKILNIAGYSFTPLNDLPYLQAYLAHTVRSSHCKGTILLSEEGININLAGLPQDIAAFKKVLKEDPRFANIDFKKSYSDSIPFRFVRVKIKKEIITMKCPDIRPEISRAPSISPADFKKWLDDKKDITIVDTRNDYEIRFGTFEQAINLHTHDFSEFPEASAVLPKDNPIVMFCTGGVRCEKAALHLMKAGYDNVYQLEGGILNYFQEVGGSHYKGECFVFDERIALNEKLEKTGTQQCVHCEGPLFVEQECTTCNITFS